ncbi:glycerophosphodiester phosphodiesterase [Planctomicrobium piriforme]|uniref:Glycerophosphoryl diester phosphodiesterase n=1 Tax=Planctomicrobium piriforme TaxID=1576369 RepID=A0A1I3NDQ6_9PLAN|nr:glycerophosphodiester phosphodiesterase [Planctomicrobium piriforme]SFJ07319.1 glycerophosphoryl diester phosphodiesterase [Planctomicrobium piriforme]
MLKFATLLAASLLTSALCLADGPVEIIAHRGASFDAPENTISSVKLAWEQGADGCEFDLHLTQDGKIIACHDDNTKKTAGVDKKIVDTLFDDLRQLDVGSWKFPAFKGEKMPSFEEILAVVPPGKKIYIEVKCGPEIVPELLRQLKASSLQPKLTPVICFNAKVIAAVKQQRPDLPAYLLSDLKEGKTAESLIAKAKEVKADGLDLKAGPELDQTFADKVRAAGLRLDVWTVNDVALAKRMAAIGVQGITTDRPQWLREQMSKQ